MDRLGVSGTAKSEGGSVGPVSLRQAFFQQTHRFSVRPDNASRPRGGIYPGPSRARQRQPARLREPGYAPARAPPRRAMESTVRATINTIPVTM
jgi:hypothetical protein